MRAFLIYIAGLIVGFGAFLLIFLVVTREKKSDNFYTKKCRLFRVRRVSKGPLTDCRTGVPFPVPDGPGNPDSNVDFFLLLVNTKIFSFVVL